MFPSQVREIIEKAVDNPLAVQPLMLWGPPGIGKSAIPKQVAAERKIGFIDIRGPQLDPTDLRGIPTVQGDKAKWLPPTFLPQDGRGLLFLDELVSAPPLVQASMYQLCLDRYIGEYHLPDGWYVIAAGNRIQDRAVSYRMPSALANRFTHIEFEPSLEDWTRWAIHMAQPPVNPNIVAFVNFKSDLLAPEFNKESAEHAFPTPRTWEFASRLIHIGTGAKLLPELLEGTIGKGATAEFLAFLKVQTELPDIKTIFGGSNFWPDKRMDLKYALVAALATRAKSVNDYERMVQYSEHVDEEFSILLITMLANKDIPTMARAPSWSKWSRDHADIIIARKVI